MDILILTKYYPYGTGEAFLESEIEIISNYYTNIVIIACDVANEMVNTIRPLPQNVTSFYVPNSSKLKDLCKGIRLFFSKNTTFLNEANKTQTLKSKFFLAYFEEKCQRIYKHITEKNYIINLRNKKFVLYSYWLFTTARVGTLIANNLHPVYSFCRAHRYDLYEDQNVINYLPYRNFLLDKYDDIFPCSQDGANYILKKYNKPTTTFYLGTLDNGLCPENTDSIFKIVSCSRVEQVKRVEKIVHALALLDNSNLKIEWIHIGAGSKLKKVKKCASDKLHKIKYTFMGEMKNKDILFFYKKNKINLFINVSSSEGLPVSIMEAISFGIPVIATNVGGTSEIVLDKITGKLLSKDFTSTELAQIIENFYSSKHTIDLKKSCRHFWKQHFDAISQYEKTHQFIKNKVMGIKK